MSFTLAEHRRNSRSIDRTLHVGMLVCFGLSNDPDQEDMRLNAGELKHAADEIWHDVMEIWRPFTFTDQRTRFHYRFAFQVVLTSNRAPISTVSLTMEDGEDPNHGGRFRYARSALVEARSHGVENVVIVSPHLNRVAHGQTITAQGEIRETSGGDPREQERLTARGGVQERTSNAIVLYYRRDILSGTHTPAHETGHLLGLRNTTDSLDIMGLRRDDEHARNRRVTEEDRRLLHAVIESRVPGFERPAAAQTSGRQRQYRFDGATYAREAP